MNRSNFFLAYGLLTLVQLLICNYLNLSPYLVLSLLPVMVLCIPVRFSPVASMLIAFATALVVDLLSDGVPGLNSLALVPVAFARKWIVGLVFGEDVLVRGEDFSIRRNGYGKVAFAVTMVQALFLVIYIWADGAGTRPFWFNLVRFACSLACVVIAAMLVVDTLSPDRRS